MTENMINQRRRDNWLRTAAAFRHTAEWNEQNGRECYVAANTEAAERAERIAELFDADARDAAKAIEQEAFEAGRRNAQMRGEDWA